MKFVKSEEGYHNPRFVKRFFLSKSEAVASTAEYWTVFFESDGGEIFLLQPARYFREFCAAQEYLDELVSQMEESS